MQLDEVLSYEAHSPVGQRNTSALTNVTILQPVPKKAGGKTVGKYMPGQRFDACEVEIQPKVGAVSIQINKGDDFILLSDIVAGTSTTLSRAIADNAPRPSNLQGSIEGAGLHEAVENKPEGDPALLADEVLGGSKNNGGSNGASGSSSSTGEDDDESPAD